jgi:hypothetical protein
MPPPRLFGEAPAVEVGGFPTFRWFCDDEFTYGDGFDRLPPVAGFRPSASARDFDAFGPAAFAPFGYERVADGT